MATEIIVVVENEDARGCVPGAVEVCRCQSADAAANDDKIIGLAGVGDLAGLSPEVTVAQAMSALETSRVISRASP